MKPDDSQPPTDDVSRDTQTLPPPGRQALSGVEAVSPDDDTRPLPGEKSAEIPASAEPDPGSSWGRFRIDKLLGKGGMGRVYQAFDPTLGRTVALKIIHGDNPELAERLLREARTQARIDHPNVCRVHEAGMASGRPYIVMQHLRGATADRAAERMTVEQKARIVLEAAEGIHAAHRLGLIHRDIKPNNIMVEPVEGGDWKATVLDFGLAREVMEPGLTRTGMVVGTPAFMPPEQARGEVRQLDRRVDVYSLGATLYTLLAGQEPFQGLTAAELMVALLTRDPEPLSAMAPGIPRDLQVITARCMEKEPSQRYESAKALADELRRFLDGDPILARPPSLYYRLKTKVRRHRPAFIGATVAFAALLAAMAMVWQSRREAEQKARLAQEFGREVQRVEGTLRFSCLSPLHDISRNRQAVREQMAWIRSRATALGSVAEAPAAYALGRGFLALGDPENARLQLERAWELGQQGADVAYALGLVYGRLYERELNLVLLSRNREQREARRREVERLYRDPALRYLRQSRAGHEDGGGTSDYLEALIAFYGKDYPSCLRVAAAALAKEPWLYEAGLLQGKALQGQALDAREAGRTADAVSGFKAAIEAFRNASETGRSDPATHSALADAWLTLQMETFYGSDTDVEPMLAEAEAAAERALKADPGNAEAWTTRATVWLRRGENRASHGGDPERELAISLRFARQAAALDPGSFLACYRIGTACRILADYRLNHGKEAGEALQGAIQAFGKALEINPASSPVCNSLGNALQIRAVDEDAHGKDPRASLRAAVEAYRRALAIDPRNSSAFSNLGAAFNRLGEWELTHGLDPTSSSRSAIEALRAALALKPDDPYPRNNLAVPYLTLARFTRLTGANPAPFLGEAVANTRKSRELKPDYISPWMNEAMARFIEAEDALLRGKDFSDALGEFLGLCERARRIDPTHSQLLANEVDGRLRFDLLLLETGHPGVRGLSDTRELLGLLRSQQWPDLPFLLSLQRFRDAMAAAAAGQDATALFRTAWEEMEAFAQARPPAADEMLVQVRLLYRLAESSSRHGGEASTAIDTGLALCEKLLAVNPRLTEAIALEGALLLAGSGIAGVDPARAAEWRRKGTLRLEEALRLNPLLARIYNLPPP